MATLHPLWSHISSSPGISDRAFTIPHLYQRPIQMHELGGVPLRRWHNNLLGNWQKRTAAERLSSTRAMRTQRDISFDPHKCEHKVFTQKEEQDGEHLYHPQRNQIQSRPYWVPRGEDRKWLEMLPKYVIYLWESIQQAWLCQQSLSLVSTTAQRQSLYAAHPTSCGIRLTATQSRELEGIQRRAARSVNNLKRTDRATSVSTLIEAMNCTHCGQDDRLPHTIDIHCRLHEEAPDAVRNTTLQYSYTVSYMNSFFVKTARAWNNLPVGSPLLVGPPVAG